MADLETYTALQKFGLGARYDEANLVGVDPESWLLAQLTDVSSVLDEYNLPSSQYGIQLFFDYREALRNEQGNADQPLKSASTNVKDRMTAFVVEMEAMKREQMLFEDNGVRGDTLSNAQNTWIAAAKKHKSKPAADKTSDELLEEMIGILYMDQDVRTRHAVITPASFREALVRFWSDHFNVFALKSTMLIPSAIAMEREAIRPHITGSFLDMLLAVETHPVMHIYLDNWLSIGPNSWVGQEYGLGLNENLAREILELHTLGVGGGYDQNDIIAFAKAITGWSVGNPNVQPENLGLFIFEPLYHEPGTVTFMKKAYPGAAQDQGLDILVDLASHPSTAKFIAEKLARHFHSDTPPQSLIDRLELAFNNSNGDLLTVSSTLVTSPEMWDGSFAKLRNSEEFVLGILRGFGFESLTPEQTLFVFDSVAQVPFFQPSPAGWPKDEASWASSSIISARINLANLISGVLSGLPEPSAYAQNLLGPLLDTHTSDAIAAAETVEQGYTLLQVSPEMQRR